MSELGINAGITISWVNCVECNRVFPVNLKLRTDQLCSKCEWHLDRECQDRSLSVPMRRREALLSSGPQGAD